MLETAAMQWQELHGIWLIGAALTAFIVVATAEMLWPLRDAQAPVRARWKTNSFLYLLNITIMFVTPITSFGAAIYASSNSLGLWPLLGGLHDWVLIVLALIVLDFSKYLLHVLLHHVPLLWRLHKVHHADPDIDLSTGVRFHPLETIVTLAWSIAVVLLMGAPIVAVLIHEVLITVAAFYGHANIVLPTKLERLLRLILVTPQMHTVHHSLDIKEGNHNFGGVLSIWDRLFRTYLAKPKLGLRGMRFGLAGVARDARLPALFKLPFQGR